jgi:uncharacterized protein with von Willebrand factor type A (vWA) domain
LQVNTTSFRGREAAEEMAESAIAADSARESSVKTLARSEKRQRSNLLGLRLLPEERQRLEEEASRRGFRSAQELVLDQLKPVLTAAS